MAPAIRVPFDFHWYARSTGAGVQVPAEAVRVAPTAAVPVMDGIGPDTGVAGTVAVGLLVADVVCRPEPEAVSVTVIFLPCSAVVTR